MDAEMDRNTLRSLLAANAAAIEESLVSDPEDYDYRDPLWMERHRMLRQMRELA